MRRSQESPDIACTPRTRQARRFLRWCCAVLAATSALAHAESATPADIEAYGALPAVSDLRVSPDGKRVALLRPIRGALGVTVIDLATRAENLALAPDPKRYTVIGCLWANSVRLLCRVRGATHEPTTGGGQRRVLRVEIIAVGHDGTAPMYLRGAERPTFFNSAWRDDVVATLPGESNYVLLPATQGSDSVLEYYLRRWPSVWKYDLRSGERTRVKGEIEGISLWLADSRGELLAGFGARYRSARATLREGNEWRSFDLSQACTKADCTVLHVDDDASRIVVAAGMGQPYSGVYALDTRGGKAALTLHREAGFDVDATPIVVGGVLKGINVETNRRHFVPLDSDWQALMNEISRALPDTPLLPWSHDAAGSVIALRSATPFRPVAWFLFDRAARKLTRVGSEYPRLERQEVPETRWVEYPARDGRMIPAQLTLPTTRRTDLPVVVLPHDWPLDRDRPEFDYLAVFLASRGYAVLQPQYRGSFGFGRAHLEAGFLQWGRGTYLDVLDGMSWLRSQGIAGAQGACVVGIGYGGYLAVLAGFRGADDVRCVAGYMPRTEPPRSSSDGYVAISSIAGLPAFGEVMPNFDDEESPLERAADFRVPVLLMHGDQVEHVARASVDLEAALRKAGKPVTRIAQVDADGTLGVQVHRREWLTALADFIERHTRR